jgi:hypothetical protein
MGWCFKGDKRLGRANGWSLAAFMEELWVLWLKEQGPQVSEHLRQGVRSKSWRAQNPGLWKALGPSRAASDPWWASTVPWTLVVKNLPTPQHRTQGHLDSQRLGTVDTFEVRVLGMDRTTFMSLLQAFFKNILEVWANGNNRRKETVHDDKLDCV